MWLISLSLPPSLPLIREMTCHQGRDSPSLILVDWRKIHSLVKKVVEKLLEEADDGGEMDLPRPSSPFSGCSLDFESLLWTARARKEEKEERRHGKSMSRIPLPPSPPSPNATGGLRNAPHAVSYIVGAKGSGHSNSRFSEFIKSGPQPSEAQTPQTILEKKIFCPAGELQNRCSSVFRKSN